MVSRTFEEKFNERTHYELAPLEDLRVGLLFQILAVSAELFAP